MNLDKDLKKLDNLIVELDNKSLSIEESLDIYNKAIILAKKCVEEISSSKGKLELLTKELERINLDGEIDE